MKRSSSLNRGIVATLLLIVNAGCGGAADNNDAGDTDTVNNAVSAVVPSAGDSIVAQPVDTIVTPEPKTQGTAIDHQSEDDRKLDSIKKAKRKDKVPVNRAIEHSSENDNLLDSIKQAKRKGKN